MFDYNSLIWTYLAYIIVIIGIFALCYQFKKSKDLSEGHLILNLHERFIKNHDIQSIYLKLELYNQGNHQVLSDEDIPQITEYISFFGIIYNLNYKKVLGFDTIDHLFSTKYFLFINNPFIQQYLVANKETYQIQFRLYENWLNYKKKMKKIEPFSEHSFSIMIGRKNTLPKMNRSS